MSPIPFSHLPFGNLHKRAASQGAIMMPPFSPKPPAPFKVPAAPKVDYAQRLAEPNTPHSSDTPVEAMARTYNAAHKSVTPIETMQHAYGAQTGPVIDSARSYQAAHPEIAFPNQLDDATLNKHVPVNIAAPGTSGAAGPDEQPTGTGGYSTYSTPFSRAHISIFENHGADEVRPMVDHEMLHQTQSRFLDNGLSRFNPTMDTKYTMSPAEMGARIPALNRAYVAGGQPFPKTPEDADQVLHSSGIYAPGDTGASEFNHMLEPLTSPFWRAGEQQKKLPYDTRDLINRYQALPPDQQKQQYDKWRSVLPGVVSAGTPSLAGKTAASAFGSATITPVSATNIITSPAGMDEDNATASSSKTPLDMPSPQQSPTEQALGASADDLKLRDDHAKLQADHQKLQQQFDTAKQQALLAKANKPAPAAAPKNDSMGKYKSMSMQLMGAHLDRVKQNLKGLSEGAGGLPMQLKLACAFRAIKLLEKAAAGPPNHTWAAPPRFVGPPSPATFHPRDMSNAPASSLAPKLSDNMPGGIGTSATGKQVNLGAGTGNIAETSDNAQRLSRLTAGPAPGGWVDSASNWLGKLPGGSVPAAGLRTAPGMLRTMGAGLGSMVGNEESQKDMNALTSTATPALDTAQDLAARPDSTKAAPLNLNVIRGLDPVAKEKAMQAYYANLTEPQKLQMETTGRIRDTANTYAENPAETTVQQVMNDRERYAGTPDAKGVQHAAPGVGPWEQWGRKALDLGTDYAGYGVSRFAGASDRMSNAGDNLSHAGTNLVKAHPLDAMGDLAGAAGNLARAAGDSAAAASTFMPTGMAGLGVKIPAGAVRAGASLTSAAGRAALRRLGVEVGLNTVGVPHIMPGAIPSQHEQATGLATANKGMQHLADTTTQMNATNRAGQYATAYGQQPVTNYQNPGFWGWLMSMLGQGPQLPQGVPAQAYQPGYFDTQHTQPYSLPQ